MPESVLIELFGPSIKNVIKTITPDELPREELHNDRSATMKEWAGAIADEKLSWVSRFRLAAQFVAHLQ